LEPQASRETEAERACSMPTMKKLAFALSIVVALFVALATGQRRAPEPVAIALPPGSASPPALQHDFASVSDLSSGETDVSIAANDAPVARTRPEHRESEPVGAAPASGPRRLRLRLLDVDGTPARSSAFTTGFSSSPDAEWEPDTVVEQAWTDAGGCLAITIDAKTPAWFGIVSEDRLAEYVEIRHALSNSSAVPRDVQLREAPVLIAGRIVYPDGSPAERSQLHIAQYYPGANEPNGPPWMHITTHIVKPGDDGRFRILSNWTRGPLGAYAVQNRRGRSERVMFEAGATGVEIVLIPSGSIAGGVHGSALIAARTFVVTLTPAVPPAKPSDIFTARAREIPLNGTFHEDGLLPGRWTVAIGADGSAPIWTRDDVEVVAGQTTELASIDLDRVLPRVRIEVLDESGAFLKGAEVRVISAGVTPGVNVPAVEPGVYELVVDARGADLDVRANGCVPVTLKRVGSSQRVVLRPE
jgi:hypothetical protein